MYNRIRHYRIHLYPYAMKNVPYLHGSFIGSSPLPVMSQLRWRNKTRRRSLRKILLVPWQPATYNTMQGFHDETRCYTEQGLPRRTR